MFQVVPKLLKSIVTDDILILLAAVIELVLFIVVWRIADGIFVKREKKKGVVLSKKSVTNSGLVISYSIFECGISVFPLLGMLGTVSALLNLDLSAGDMANIRNNFFMALTSTAWGIIFAVLFKLLHAWKAPYFEDRIAESYKLVDECKKIFEEAER